MLKFRSVPLSGLLQDRNYGAAALMILLSAAADLPLLADYHRFGDDYPISAGSIAEFFHGAGIWRIVSLEICAWLAGSHVYGIAAIFVHAAVGYIFYQVARVAFESASYAVFLAILVVAFPWGYQALVWDAAFSFAMTTAFFWLMCLILLTCRPRGPCFRASTLIGILTLALLCLLCNEVMFGPVCVAGLLVFCRRDGAVAPRRWTVPLALAPLAAAASWAAAYELTKTSSAPKQISALDFRALLSVLYYQYSNLEVFDLWLLPALRRYVLSLLNPLYASVAAILLLGVIALLIYAYFTKLECAGNSRRSPAALEGVLPGRFLAVSVILLFASTSIYVLGGGYSLDLHKRYVIVPFVIMVVGAMVRPLVLHWSRSRSAARLAVVMVCVVGTGTSFMMMTLWHHEMAKMSALLDLVAASGSRPAAIEWNPYIHDIWPRSQHSWGEQFDAEWSIDLGLAARNTPPLHTLPPKNQIAAWQDREGRWAWVAP